MAKRNAANELNHDNWDKEEESEEAGTFKQVNPHWIFQFNMAKIPELFPGLAMYMEN